MKKSAVAFAVLGTFAGAAFAQANVNIYGIVDAGLVREFGNNVGTPAGKSTKLTSGVQSGSRIGFKGTEDLGGGLSANFTLENGFLTDTGGIDQQGQLFGRQAWVGLAGNNWGSLNFGRQYTPIFIGLDSIDPFGTGLAGASTNMFGTVVRMNNTVKYSTANMSGFTADLAYGFGEVPGSTAASRQIGLGAAYANGPIYATLAHQNVNNATDTNKTKLTLLGGTYDFNVVKAHIGYQTEKDSATLDRRDWLLGVSAPLGVGTLMASYIRKDDKSSLNQDANQLALGYTHAISKRTNLYTAIARISNKNGAAYTVGNATEGGTTDKAFNVGIRHKF